MVREKELINHRFVDSKDEVGVQVSDALVGVIGRAFTYANRTSQDIMEEDLGALNDVQRQNLSLLASLINRSIEENDVFSNYVISAADRARMAMILGGH